MKKSVIALITIIYIASIVLVSFYGLQFQTFDEMVYVGEIHLVEDNLTKIEGGLDCVIIKDEDGDGVWTYQINCLVLPENASNKNIVYSYDRDKDGVTVNEETGVVTFTKKAALTVTVKPEDGSDVSAVFQIRAR